MVGVFCSFVCFVVVCFSGSFCGFFCCFGLVFSYTSGYLFLLEVARIAFKRVLVSLFQYFFFTYFKDVKIHWKHGGGENKQEKISLDITRFLGSCTWSLLKEQRCSSLLKKIQALRLYLNVPWFL